jgi:hypothetical protein
VALAALALPARAAQTVIRLTVSPMAAPKPALRYLLLPELKEMSPGNPIPAYLRCVLERSQAGNSQEAQRRETLLAMPLDRLPARELQDYGGARLREVDRAARLDTPDWQILPRTRTDGIGLLIPDVQVLRTLAADLKLRFRAEVALGRYDDALRTARTMFAMGRHLGEHPTVVGSLVGIAIVSLAIGPLEEMLERPGCPNLYWALTDLPNPVVPWQRGLEGERVSIRGEFRDLDDTAPMTPEQVNKFIKRYEGLLRQGTKDPLKPYRTSQEWLEARTKDETLVRAARGRLVERGLAEGLVKRMPAGQVVLLDEWREFEVRRDELMKLMNLPAWQFEALSVAHKVNKVKQPPALFDLVLISPNFRRSPARLEQRLGLLRCVEALRLHAAARDGKLPAKLADVEVPLPDDPLTGKPFRYALEGQTARLRGTPPPGREDDPAFNIVYEITIRK